MRCNLLEVRLSGICLLCASACGVTSKVADGFDAGGVVSDAAPAVPDAPQLSNDEGRVTFSEGRSFSPRLVKAGDGYGLIWLDDRGGSNEIYFAGLDAHGNKLGDDTQLTSGGTVKGGGTSALVFDGRTFAFSWSDSRDGDAEIYFARLDARGNKLGGDVRVTNAAGFAYVPEIVATEKGYALAWQDDRTGAIDVYFALLDGSGSKLGVETDLSRGSGFVRVALAWTGSEYGVAWTRTGDTGGVSLALVDAAGARMGEHVVATSGDSPRLTWNGNSYGVAYEAGYANSIMLARVDAAGHTLDTQVVVPHGRVEELIATPNGYGLMWVLGIGECAVCPTGTSPFVSHIASLDALGNRLGDAGAGDDPQAPSTTTPDPHRSLAWTGSGYAFAYADARPGNQEIYFAERVPP
jgi:hypothetical protein